MTFPNDRDILCRAGKMVLERNVRLGSSRAISNVYSTVPLIQKLEVNSEIPSSTIILFLFQSQNLVFENNEADLHETKRTECEVLHSKTTEGYFSSSDQNETEPMYI